MPRGIRRGARTSSLLGTPPCANSSAPSASQCSGIAAPAAAASTALRTAARRRQYLDPRRTSCSARPVGAASGHLLERSHLSMASMEPCTMTAPKKGVINPRCALQQTVYNMHV